MKKRYGAVGAKEWRGAKKRALREPWPHRCPDDSGFSSIEEEASSHEG
jgi:hypothetical protein